MDCWFVQECCFKTHIHKRRNCTLWFWRIWISQVRLSVKNKATGTPHGSVLYTFFIGIGVFQYQCWYYIYIYVGLSSLLVSTDRAMREPRYVERATELAPRFFVYVAICLILTAIGSRWHYFLINMKYVNVAQQKCLRAQQFFIANNHHNWDYQVLSYGFANKELMLN